jgi:diaminopimelate decarboxylase
MKTGSLFCDGVELTEIAAKVGTPAYVYSSHAISERFKAYDESLQGIPHRVCYAVKANANLSVLRQLVSLGAGFDIVSGGELYRVLQAGGSGLSVVFSGVGKTREEIEFALDHEIHSFNSETEAEIELIDALAARTGQVASVSVRVNPDVDASTHPYISTGLKEHKFGISIDDVEGVYERAAKLKHVRLDGVSCHIGSQLLDPTPMLDAAKALLDLVERLRKRGFEIKYLDLGGGLGVPYRPQDKRPDVRAFMDKVKTLVEGHDLFLMFEPGRSIVADAGVLLTRALYRKKTEAKEFLVVDAAMNDLIRPALYGAHHEIVPLRVSKAPGTMVADVVGPVCESADFLAKDRELPQLFPGDLLAVMTAGAYAMVASSNYNARPRPAEVMVDGSSWRIVRARETFDDLVRGE